MTFEVVVSTVAFCMSLLLFDRFTEERSTSAGSGWMSNLLASNHTSRAWDNAAEWKSWHVLTGGLRWFLIRAIGGTVISFGIVSVIVLLVTGELNEEGICIGSFWVALVIFLLSVGRMLGLVYQTEIQQKTLSTLVMLPKPAAHTFLSMLKGLLPAMLGSFIPVIIGFVTMMMVMMQSSYFARDFTNMFGEPWIWHLLTWALLTLALATFLSTRVRHGALLIAIGLLWFVGPIFFSVFVGLLVRPLAGSGGGEFFRYVIPMGLIAVEVLASGLLIKKTFEHLEVLAAR